MGGGCSIKSLLRFSETEGGEECEMSRCTFIESFVVGVEKVSGMLACSAKVIAQHMRDGTHAMGFPIGDPLTLSHQNHVHVCCRQAMSSR